MMRWGIAATGNISNSMAAALATIDGAEIVAVGSRTLAAADKFAAQHQISHAHGSYDDLWADPGVDIVYIGSPHSEHHAMTIAALDAGNHVLCEKAFAINAGQATEMIEAARQGVSGRHASVEWLVADIAQWEPDGVVDLLYSNATLHWLDDHATLFGRLRSWLNPAGGVAAIQMPDNWAAPTHRIPAEILDDGSWPVAAVDALLRDRLSRPEDYRRWLQPAAVDQWRTTYYQKLTGPDAVWNWLTGSVLRPVLAALDDQDRLRFAARCRQRYADAYPHDADGNVLLPFSRLFTVATG